MPRWAKNMENKSEEQFILMQATIENNKQEMKAKMKSITETLKVFTTCMMDQTNIYKYSLTQKYTSTRPYPTTLVPTNRRYPSLKGDTLPKLVPCGPSNMISAHQNSMSSPSRQNSKETLLWILRTFLTTSICVSMWWRDSEKTSFLITIPSKYTLSLNSTSSKIAIALPIPGISVYILPLDTHS